MLKWLQCLRRGHRPEFVRNVYGDEILMLGKRSIWRCGHCERWLYRDELHTPDGVQASGLSEFVRNATPERKAEVYGRVMDAVAEKQQAVIDASGVSAVDGQTFPRHTP